MKNFIKITLMSLSLVFFTACDLEEELESQFTESFSAAAGGGGGPCTPQLKLMVLVKEQLMLSLDRSINLEAELPAIVTTGQCKVSLLTKC